MSIVGVLTISSELQPYFDDVRVDAGRSAPAVRRPVEQWREWWTQAADSDDILVRTALQHGFVLTPADRLALGVTRSRTRNEVRQQRWTSAGRGMVAPIDVRDPDDRDGHLEARRRHTLLCAGAAARSPHVAISGRSDAILHGLPTLRVPERPELTVADRWEGRRPATHLYGATLDAAETAGWYGVRVEDVGRLLVTLARHGRGDAIMAADAALREGLIDHLGMARALDTAFGWPWVRYAREVLGLADPRAESPLESLTRLALHDSGFPDPQLQVVFGNDRVEFYWPKYGLVLEADGRVKYVGDASWKEKQRERRLLRHLEVRAVERVIWSDVIVDWPQTAVALWRYFR